MSDKVHTTNHVSGILFCSSNSDPLGIISLEIEGSIYINEDANLIFITIDDIDYTLDELLMFQQIQFIPDNSDLIKDEYGHIINLTIQRQYMLTRCSESETFIGYDKCAKNPIVIVNN